MSDNINNMDFKQLRNEVQLLRDELAIMKRKYEDIIYNLDTDNFSSRFVKEQGDMKTLIKVTADGIKTKVSKEDLDKSLSEYSTIEQTAEQIKSTVTKEYVSDLVDGEYVTDATLQSEIQQSADSINLSVSKTYETKSDANSSYNSLSKQISKVSIEADGITTRVEDLEDFKSSTFTQTAEGFTLDGEKTTFTGVIYLTDNDGVRRFSIFYDESQGYKQILMHNTSSTTLPIVIGDNDGNVYLGIYADGNQVATREWVLAQLGK